MSNDHVSQVLQFRIYPTNPNQTADDVRRILNAAIDEAVAESPEVASAQAEIPGAFAGVGETLVLIAIFLAKGAAGGVAAAAGKHFYDSVLKPKLQKKDLVPSDAAPKAPGGTEPDKGGKDK
jgi:hypothetical protein